MFELDVVPITHVLISIGPYLARKCPGRCQRRSLLQQELSDTCDS